MRPKAKSNQVTAPGFARFYTIQEVESIRVRVHLPLEEPFEIVSDPVE